MALRTSASGDAVLVELTFSIGGNSIEVGTKMCVNFRFTAMVNCGYVIYGRLVDSRFNILRRLGVDVGYFDVARSEILKCTFKIKYSAGDNKTETQTAYILALDSSGDSRDAGFLEFIGIDPPSWFLSTGNASGKAYKGRICDVIQQCIDDYAKGISAEIGETTDSKHNVYYMMRQDPKSFIMSLLNWSSPLTKKQTQWLVGMDDTRIVIKEQADWSSEAVGIYTGPYCADNPTIRKYKMLADNALTITNGKFVTSGISATTGEYFDKITDPNEREVFVKDANTGAKLNARISRGRSFKKAADGGPPTVGWSAIPAIPEVYSAGDLGRSYGEYIGGRARSLWLSMVNMTMRCKFTVLGHGVYHNALGLGVNTIAVEWMDIDKKPFFLAGNWLLYGFEHIYRPGLWLTDLYCSRLEYDAAAKQVP